MSFYWLREKWTVLFIHLLFGIFRGLLQFENVSYGIEPLEPSIGFEHVIYQVKHRNTGAPLYAEKDIESREKPYKIQSVEVSDQLSKLYSYYYAAI